MDNKNNKTLIFYSHSSTDKEIVERLQKFIDDVFLRFFDSFNSSDLTSIYAGDLWRKKIRENIQRAGIVVILLTPNSEMSPWVMYEAGACWMAANDGEKRVIPCLFDIEKIPSPLNEAHVVKLQTEGGLRLLVDTLANYAKGTFEMREEVHEHLIHKYLEDQASLISIFKKTKEELGPEISPVLKGILHYYGKIDGQQKFVDIPSVNKMINFLLVNDYISSDEKAIMMKMLRS